MCIIIAAQLCLTPYAGVKVQAAELEEDRCLKIHQKIQRLLEMSIPDTQSAEKTEENEFGDDDGFSDGDVETFSAEDADQFRENMRNLCECAGWRGYYCKVKYTAGTGQGQGNG
ncbi:MAG: hypothetical protein ACLVB1_10410 [Blautia obeum]